jgi:hypothetical protein
MQSDARNFYRPGDVASNPQILFEGAVLEVIARVLETGARIDLVVSDYLARYPMDDGLTYLHPDMIICVSDCLRLVRNVATAKGSPLLILDDAVRTWREAEDASRLSVDDRTTRIQACIGNIRRALGTTV